MLRLLADENFNGDIVHSFMFIKMEYWAFLLAVMALFAFIWPLLPEFG